MEHEALVLRGVVPDDDFVQSAARHRERNLQVAAIRRKPGNVSRAGVPRDRVGDLDGVAEASAVLGLEARLLVWSWRWGRGGRWSSAATRGAVKACLAAFECALYRLREFADRYWWYARLVKCVRVNMRE